MNAPEQDIALTVGEQQRPEQDRQLVEQLVEQANDQGLDLVGPDGVLTSPRLRADPRLCTCLHAMDTSRMPGGR